MNLWPEKRFNGAPLVHSAATLGHLFQRKRQVEDLDGLDPVGV